VSAVVTNVTAERPDAFNSPEPMPQDMMRAYE